MAEMACAANRHPKRKRGNFGQFPRSRFGLQLSAVSRETHSAGGLLLLLRVQSVLSQPWAVLLQLQFLAARLPPDSVVVIASLLADEENRFHLLLTLGHFGVSRIKICAKCARFNVLLGSAGAFHGTEPLILQYRPDFGTGIR